MSSLRKRVNAELDALFEKHGAYIKQAHVLEAAKERDSALYKEFERQGLWNDAVAAERGRLEYAGVLMRRYTVRMSEEHHDPIRVRAIVSLPQDRTASSGFPGYRRLDDVLKDDALRDQLIDGALMDLRACRRKYEHLKELAEVWAVIEKADQQFRRPTETEQRVSA